MAHGLFEQRGWRTEIWSTIDPTVMANVRFLAGFRRCELVDSDLVAAAAGVAGGAIVGDIEARLADRWPQRVIRPAILHLLWRGRLRTDLTTPLGRDSVLEAV